MEEKYIVWVVHPGKLASFHRVSGGEQHDFSLHDEFMQYLRELMERGDRFQ